MPKITDIKEQKRKNRFNIYLDGKFAIALSAEALAKAGLIVGQEIPGKDIRILEYQDIRNKLYNQALRFLSYRPRSEKEVIDYLTKKIRAKKISGNQFSISDNQGVSKTVELVVSKLKSLKLINDREFVRWWLEQRQTFKPKGIYALRQELRQKGISNSSISQFLNFLITPEIERESANKLVIKRLGQLEGLPYRESRKKLTQFLAYRGFSYDTIKLVLDEALKKR